MEASMVLLDGVVTAHEQGSEMTKASMDYLDYVVSANGQGSEITTTARSCVGQSDWFVVIPTNLGLLCRGLGK